MHATIPSGDVVGEWFFFFFFLSFFDPTPFPPVRLRLLERWWEGERNRGAERLAEGGKLATMTLYV